MERKGAVPPPVKIKIIGVGGGGGNAVNRMVDGGLIDPNGVEFISMNTDLQALRMSKAQITMQLGMRTTRGQGSGGDPEVGARAAEENTEVISSMLSNTDMVFLTCGMGGGTGTGATPVVARLARERGVLSVAVVTKPFSKLEGADRMNRAEAGIAELRKYVDALLVIPNDKFIEMYPDLNFGEVLYKMADDVLYKAILSIWGVVTHPGHINVDMADVRTVLKNAGEIIMTVGRTEGDIENKLVKAVKKALADPLLDNVSIEGSKRLLINVVGTDIKTVEMKAVSEYLSQNVARDAQIFFGFVPDASLGEIVEITIIATGSVGQKKTRRAVRKSADADNRPAVETTETGNLGRIPAILTRGTRILK